MNRSVDQLADRIMDALGDDADRVMTGASVEDLSRLELALGREIPADVAQYFLRFNCGGTVAMYCGDLSVYYVSNTIRAADDHRLDVERGSGEEDADEDARWNARWIPVAWAGNGDVLVIDPEDPGRGVFEYRHDDIDAPTIVANLDDLLRSMLADIESGKLVRTDDGRGAGVIGLEYGEDYEPDTP